MVLLEVYSRNNTEEGCYFIVSVGRHLITTFNRYTYFLAATFGYKSSLARHLTALQLAQFFTGFFNSFGVHMMGSACDTEASRTVLACFQIYAVGLIVLFGMFYKKKYKGD